MKRIACLFLLIASFGVADEDPPYNIYDGPAQTGVFRASILGASSVFASVPVAPTTTINSFEIHYKVGDRITVDDATMFYVYDGTVWRPLLTSYQYNVFINELAADPDYVQQRFYGGHAEDVLLAYAAQSPVEVRAFPDRARRFGSQYWSVLAGITPQFYELWSGTTVVGLSADWWDTKTWFHVRYVPVSTSEFAILTNQDNNPIVGPDDHFILTESR